MKNDTTKKIRLGIFISLGLLLLILGIYFIGDKQQLFTDTFRVNGIFKDVAGLQVGNNVRFSGINVGTVENIIIISDTTVRVEMIIEENIRKFINKNAVATIGSEGLMGNKTLVISPGLGGKIEVQNNDYIETVQPINLDDIFTSLKKTMDNTNTITEKLASITSSIESGKGAIGKMLMDKRVEEKFDSSVSNLNEGLQGLRELVYNAKESMDENFDSTFVNLKEASSEFRMLVENAKISFAKNFDSTFVNLKEGSEEFKLLIEKAKSSWLLWGF